MSKIKVFTINPKDNVAVALEDSTVPAGHKIALTDISPGQHVIKYGSPIGSATKQIRKGEHVHSHNLKTNLGEIEDYTYNTKNGVKGTSPLAVSEAEPHDFMGYRRKDGQVGIRNEIWIINTVGCVNKIAEKIAQHSRQSNHPEVYTFVHPYGCSQLGDDHDYTQKVLANLVNHPNAAGILVLGLGCENNNIEEFQKILGTWDDRRVKFLNAQDVNDDVAEGVKIVEQLAANRDQSKREPIPISELIIGLKCGASDGLSGITANPLVGRFSDAITAQGGSCLLTEVPEMFGAEALLMDRCVSEDVFDKTVGLINNFKRYFMRHGQEIYENPSPGNKEGGITTLEEKSLGCTQKGGMYSEVTDVLSYGERLRCPGLILLDGPGNDIVAVTNLAAAGAHIILFTTGRGTPLGGPVPTVKVSSNTQLAQNKANWIDFDAGPFVRDSDELADRFYDYILRVASGERAKNELNDYREIAIFKDGVTL